MPQRAINLQWPSGGLDRKYSFQRQAPYTTASCQNVWGTNLYDRRQTGGTRAGTRKAWFEQLGAGSKVNLLSSVDYVSAGYAGNGDGFEVKSGESASPQELDSALWTAPTFLAADGTPYRESGYAICDWNNRKQTGGIFKSITIDTASTYYIDLDTLLTGNAQAIFRIYARMNAGLPNAQSSGLIVAVTASIGDGGVYFSAEMLVNGSTVATFATQFITTRANVFTVTINSNTVTATFGGVALFGSGVVIASHGSDVRTGFGVETSITTGRAKLNSFGIRTNSTTNTGVRTIVVAASNGQLYADSNNIMTAVGSAVLNTSEQLQAAHHNQKLYIANYSLTTTETAKVYDPAAGTVSTLTASAGTAPTNCKLVCRYTDRVVFAGDVNNPHLWYMSRKGNPLDWDYSQLAAGDNGSAIAGQDSDAGEIGAPMTAIAPFGDDYMIMAASDALFVMRGDPAFGGQIDSISRRIGVIDKFAWTYTPEGHFLFLSKDGLYVLPSGASGEPQSISREKLPNDLFNVDITNYDVSMSFDVEFRGAWITLSNKTAGQTTSYFFDWENKAFWPMVYPSTQEVCVSYNVATPFVRGVILGCKDGYLRRHSVTASDDDGTAIDSYCEIGPIRLADSEYDEGLVSELIGTVHYGMGASVTWTTRTAKNAQSLYNSVTGSVDTRTGTWTTGTRGDGLNVKERQRIRGGAMALKLEDVSGNPWAVENVTVGIKTAGKQRVVS